MIENDDLQSEAGRELERLHSMNKEQALARLKALDPMVFEHLTALLFERRGFVAQTVGASGDEGVDVLLRRGDRTAVVQCKRYDGSVGQPTVRDLYGTMMHNRAAEAYLVTTGMITQQAREWAFGKPIQLVDGFSLVNWIMSPQFRRAEQVQAQQAATRPPQARGPRPNSQAAAVFAEDTPRAGWNRWLWPALVIFFIVFGIGVAMAYATLSARWAGADNGEAAGVLATQTSAAVALTTPSAETTVTGTVSPQATGTVTPTVAATATPCPQQVDGKFAGLYSRSALGCATASQQIVWAAWEPFERGYLLWRKDTDAAYAFYGLNGGRWYRINQTWDGGAIPDRGAPPPGLQAPERGFGFVWAASDEIFQTLGWATDKEKGFCAAVQTFDYGFILQSEPVPSCTSDGLYNQATAGDWRPVQLVAYNDEQWTTDKPGVVEPASPPTNEGAQGTRERPANQGVFQALPAGGISLDGSFGDWPGAWTPVTAVIFGRGQRADVADIAGEFQTQWDSGGLFLAVRVTDERLRSGPDGTNMWQGDGLEIHFDRALAADFNDAELSNDDYQIGISFGPDVRTVRGYRWIPYEQEAALALAGAVIATDRGYNIEVQIPWSVFAVSSPQRGETFGFNLSINDNDADEPAQETVLSASPARTDHKTPTEWGTLVLE
ncbi:MAG: restriction endonuclease [Caldilineaceae bacterium]